MATAHTGATVMTNGRRVSLAECELRSNVMKTSTVPYSSTSNPLYVVVGFEWVLRAANLPDMWFHDLRHSCATPLLAQGAAPRVVMGILGVLPDLADHEHL